MDRMFSPWRAEYIRQSAGGGGPGRCIFCAGEADLADAERLLLGVYPNSVALLNRYPYNNGHVLVAPRRHVADLWELAAPELAELFSLVAQGTRALKEAFGADALNVGMNLGKSAGAGIVDHLHVHLVPRWSGDTNFMTSVHETRVLPESLLETRERLAAAFAAMRP
jgi:ATP adenylyltransferase